MYDKVPPRREMKKTPGNRCLFCGQPVVVNPQSRDWLWAEWGEAVRIVHRACPNQPDETPA